MAGSVLRRKCRKTSRSPYWGKRGWKYIGKGHHVTSRSPREVANG